MLCKTDRVVGLCCEEEPYSIGFVVFFAYITLPVELCTTELVKCSELISNTEIKGSDVSSFDGLDAYWSSSVFFSFAFCLVAVRCKIELATFVDVPSTNCELVSALILF